MGERKNKSSLDRIERRILCNLLLIVAAYAFGVCLGVSMDKTDRKRVDMEQTDVIKCNTDIEEKHKIAITFDDGPNPEYTMKLLDGLQKRGVKATFFLLGAEVEKYPDVVKAIDEGGHLIGVHSYEHVNFGQVGDEATLEQITKTQEAIHEVTGKYAGFIRPPYGCWNKSLDEKISLIEVLWDIDPQDWATKDADTVVQRILKGAPEGSIILLHDASASSVQAAFTVIDSLQQENYEFVTVEDLLLE